ncbi:hypothetical protein D187_007553 [Cystobacter fuscus DSM 2262]|uniref:Lipoprotein n=1 Tax=Cystobacter fuscus (strain ATCC 25194 / DSM 2262 / NBRC 100088 / M29) TaxID=1242864 RepID=S9NZC9_CYSF2|nr:hypothetical protein [Cystobacter fuscus]EPX56211.1 hypothetical protein D187_007553 [Cystobacter fuscus DSM 2262]
MLPIRLLPLLALLLVACHSPETPVPPGGSGNKPPPETPPTFTVHAPGDVTTMPSPYKNVHVLLGDGGRFRERLDASGVVRFHDPAIVGPQDVSLVMVSSSGAVQVRTYLALEGPEVRLPGFAYLISGPSWTKQGTLTGRVTGAVNPKALSVSVAGEGLYGLTTLAEDGTFSIDIRGDAPGTVDLFAKETGGSGEMVLRVGLERGIAVGSGATVGGLELALDHPVDQVLNVSVEGDGARGGEMTASLEYILGGHYLFSTSASGMLPLSVPAVARTAPFDTFTPMLSITSGDAAMFPDGALQTSLPAVTSSVTATFLAPLRITSPAVGPREAPASASRSGLVMSWVPDRTAHLTEMGLEATTGASPLDWRVMAPTSITSFTPFALPADLVPVTTFPAGSYRVWANSIWSSHASGYADFFTGRDIRDPDEEVRTTRLLAYVELQ